MDWLGAAMMLGIGIAVLLAIGVCLIPVVYLDYRRQIRADETARKYRRNHWLVRP